MNITKPPDVERMERMFCLIPDSDKSRGREVKTREEEWVLLETRVIYSS